MDTLKSFQFIESSMELYKIPIMMEIKKVMEYDMELRPIEKSGFLDTVTEILVTMKDSMNPNHIDYTESDVFNAIRSYLLFMCSFIHESDSIDFVPNELNEDNVFEVYTNYTHHIWDSWDSVISEVPPISIWDLLP